jgi:hypothetical protein
MKIYEGEHYYNEKGEMGVLISVNHSFASECLDMATDKRIIELFLNFCEKNRDGYMVLKSPITSNADLIEDFISTFGYNDWFDYQDMQFKLEFIPIGIKFTVECKELYGDYGEFECYYDQIIFSEDFEWAEAK